MLKFFLAVLAAVGCSIGGLTSGGSMVFVIGAFVCYGAAVVFLIQWVGNCIRSFVNTHRQVRQSIDDERIRKFHEYGKGDGNGL